MVLAQPLLATRREQSGRHRILRTTDKEHSMKNALVCGFAAVVICLMAAGVARAQSGVPPVPTTHILAIGTLNPGVDPAAARAILPSEVRETVKLHLDGKIDQWFSLQGRPGVVFILNMTDTAAAHEMLEKLPLGQAHLMSFELIPVGPLNPLRQLLGTATGSP
ncbi:hypothetical protein AAFG13_10760 [Bradyrhizobium sp. B124]|uniref:hypothetical protein n=1 Tax=Bradyrhizobium sp. B124 TaxID=3140245 RepID=UPI003182C7C6